MSTQPRVYRTGICALSEQEVTADRRWWPSLQGAGFTFEFRPHVPTAERKEAAKTIRPRFRKSFRPPEVHILASDHEAAASAALLLYASHALIEAGVPAKVIGWGPYRAIPTARAELREFLEMSRFDPPTQSIYLQSAGIVDVAGLAARLSRRRKWTQAAYFHLASVYLINIDSIDLHPGERDASFFHTPHLMHRVWEAQSLFAAFQVVELLDLAVKGARADRPSVVAKKWDPGIRKDLEERLGTIGIEPTQTMSWAVRGRRKGLRPKLQDRTSESRPSRWASGDIKDETIPFVDAINRAHWLRSNVSAHRTSNVLSKLSLLDALNVQHLARRLLMNAVSFPWWENRDQLGSATNCS